ncbi:hypothetical protein CEXT_211541 [Caerostris extrusa]|uniref:Uncharacterized protein n=1 Tax=Caerostris extrusa TaxID=172846 RepID=A0AAV4X0D2_CAEEX|nr:hypothetical protein CEXT_211541 [Caerostris extrusa]
MYKWRLVEFPVWWKEDRKQMARPPERRPHETAIVTSHRHRFLTRREGERKKKGIKNKRTNGKGGRGLFFERNNSNSSQPRCGLPRLI